MNSPEVAEVHITKLTAARRQLCAAIRMFFSGEDELAVHTVASAAYKIITDLKQQRGYNEVSDYYSTMIFYCVRSYRQGTLPAHMTEDANSMDVIREWSEAMPNDEDFGIEDFNVHVPLEESRKFWKNRTKISNFLKHADYDSASHISMRDVDNFHLLLVALGSYLDLDTTGLGHEGCCLWMYSNVKNKTTAGLSPDQVDIVTTLGSRSQVEQLKFFSEVLNDL